MPANYLQRNEVRTAELKAACLLPRARAVRAPHQGISKLVGRLLLGKSGVYETLQARQKMLYQIAFATWLH